MSHELTLSQISVRSALAPRRIAAQEVLARMAHREPIVFVDARREDEWRKATETLPGALRLAPRPQDETLPIIPRGRSVVTFCTCAHEASSARVAELLMAHGLTDVHPLYGGLQAWRRAGGPLQAR